MVLGTIVFQSGMNYERAKMPDAAREAYRRTIRDYPNTPAAEAARKVLAKRS
jgi:TolA-binding protein